MRIKVFISIVFLLSVLVGKGQDSANTYKKPVLKNTEIDLLMSYYEQEGDNAAVTGGIGKEKLTNSTPTVIVSIPLSTDDVLTVDAGISTYTSASSSNINPFDKSGASVGDEEEEEEEDEGFFDDKKKSSEAQTSVVTGTPWLASSGASKKDIHYNAKVNYSHQSNDRNLIWGANVSFAKEYDYTSFGFGGKITRLFNDKNTNVGLKMHAYFDQWLPIYPTELEEYNENGEQFLNQDFFAGVNVINKNGSPSDQYAPNGFNTYNTNDRNTYSASLFFSQILSRRMKFAVFGDLVYQYGLLSTPYHRVYFADKDDYYIGNYSDIQFYKTSDNNEVFHLADDVERLPSVRWKLPLGLRFNYYISETFILRTYYRYYSDSWKLSSHTASLELPISLGKFFTLIPIYRYYMQDEVKYFAPYNAHESTSEYYTSDYDLASFRSHKMGLGFRYRDIFSKFNIGRLGLKQIDLRYNYYTRSNGLSAHIISLDASFAFMSKKD